MSSMVSTLLRSNGCSCHPVDEVIQLLPISDLNGSMINDLFICPICSHNLKGVWVPRVPILLYRIWTDPLLNSGTVFSVHTVTKEMNPFIMLLRRQFNFTIGLSIVWNGMMGGTVMPLWCSTDGKLFWIQVYAYRVWRREEDKNITRDLLSFIKENGLIKPPISQSINNYNWPNRMPFIKIR